MARRLQAGAAFDQEGEDAVPLGRWRSDDGRLSAQKCGMSIAASGSVAVSASRSPGAMARSALRALSTGSGQARPLVSMVRVAGSTSGNGC